MPNSNVEIIISGTRGVIDNAVSEASLQELLKAIQKLDKNSGGETNRGSTAGAAAAYEKSSSEIADSISKLDSKAANAIKKSVDMFKGAMDRNTNTFSDFARVMNDTFIKKVPLVGGLVGGFLDIFVMTTAVVESWNSTLKKTSAVGANFGNSALALRHAAANARMDLDEFANIVVSNAQGLSLLSGDVRSGAERLSISFENLYNGTSGARERLLQLGITQEESGDMFAKWLIMTNQGNQENTQRTANLNKAFVGYIENLDALASMSGVDRKSLAQKVAAVEQDVIYQRSLAKLDPQEQGKMRTRLTRMVALFGDQGADLHKAQAANTTPVTQGAFQILGLAQGMRQVLDEDLRQARDHNVTEEEYNKGEAERTFKLYRVGLQHFKNNRSFFMATLATAEGQRQLGPGMTKMLQDLLSFGDISKMTDAQLRKAIQDSRGKKDKYEGITKILDTFSQAFKDARKNFFDTLIPVLKGMGEALKPLPDLLKQAGEQLSTWIKDVAYPAMRALFENMFSEEGREKIYAHLESWARLMYVEVKAIISDLLKKTWVPDLIIDSVLGDTEGNRSQAAAKNALERNRVGGSATSNGAPQTAIQSTAASAVGSDISTNNETMVVANTIGVGTQNFAAPTSGGRVTGVYLTNDSSREMVVPGAVDSGFGTGTVPLENSARSWELEKKYQPFGSPISGLITVADAERQLLEIWDEKANAGQGITVRFTGFDKEKSRAIFDAIRGKPVTSGQTIGIGPSNWLSSNSIRIDAFRGRPEAGQTFDPMILFPNQGAEYGKKTSTRNASPPLPAYRQYSTGTLGATGKLFGEFGAGTKTILHGREAVVTPQQLEGIVNSKDQIEMVQFISSLNTNMANLLEIARQELYIDQNKAHVQKGVKMPYMA